MLTLLLVATTGISISIKPQIIYIKPKFNVSALPVLNENAKPPVISAQGVFAQDLSSGVYLYQKNPNKKLLPASTTKVMTGIIALEQYDQNEIVKIGNFKTQGKKMGLYFGEEITVKDLLYGALVYSGNDAAEALARAHPKGREAFIAEMNKKASALGLENTNFVNPSGLENLEHFSSARDLVVLSEYAMRNPEFAKIVATKDITVSSADDRIFHKLTTVNDLLGEVEGVLGVKTGWTQNSRENLVTLIERDGKKVMIALLGSGDRFEETKTLIDWIFNNYTWEELEFNQPSSAGTSSVSAGFSTTSP